MVLKYRSLDQIHEDQDFRSVISYSIILRTVVTTHDVLRTLADVNISGTCFLRRGAYHLKRRTGFIQFDQHESFTTGKPFLGTKLLGFSMGKVSGALKRLRPQRRAERH